MKKTIMTAALGLAIAWGVALPAAAAGESKAPDLGSEKDRISYATGVEAARNFKREGVEFDPEVFLRGMQDAISGQRLSITEAELKKIMNEFQVKVRQSMAANRKAASDENRKKAVAFLEANKDHEGVHTLPSGLQFKVVKPGEGERRPVSGDKVVVEYRGTLLDGTQFDATNPGKPATLEVSKVIPGWRDALVQMKVGSEWHLYVPPALAYGERGVGTDIGPNELLEFDVHLVDIK